MNKNITIADTKENKAIVGALKKIAETKWVGELFFDSIYACASSINLNTLNSGHYKPVVTKINGLTGMYIVNQDGSIFFESRIIKEDEKKCRIETMSTDGYNRFERHYSEIINAAE